LAKSIRRRIGNATQVIIYPQDFHPAPLAQPGETGTLNLYIPDRKRRISRSLREYRHSQ
jgi:hypothetical protein